MDPKKIEKLRDELESLRRRGSISSREMERFAASIGRKPSNRGKEPVYVNVLLPNRRPIAIPHHSKPLKKWTARNILNDLEQDLDELELLQDEEERGDD